MKFRHTKLSVPSGVRTVSCVALILGFGLTLATPLAAQTVDVQPDGTVERCTGQTVTFTAVVTGFTSPTYQWTRNGTDIGGATGSWYTIPLVAYADEGNINCRVREGASPPDYTDGTDTFLDVQQPVQILTQPNNAAICSGGTVTITSTYGGDPAPTVVWSKVGFGTITSGPTGNGSTYAITSGAGTTTLSILGAVNADAGSYQYTVTNVCGGVTTFTTSSAAVVSPDSTPPTFTSGCTNQTLTTTPGLCSAPFSYTPAATDNCAILSIVPLVAVPASPLGTGIHTFSYRATDTAGNFTDCTFTVTVVDNEPPVATVPANPVFVVATGPTVVTFTTSATDNCPGVTQVCSPPSGSTFPAGRTPVTCTTTDGASPPNVVNSFFDVFVCVTPPAPATVWVDDTWTGLANGVDPDGPGGAEAIGCDAFSTIQAGVNAVATGGMVFVAAGTYTEDINVNQACLVQGAGASTTIVSGPMGGDGATFRFTASGAVIDGFTITRVGNNLTDWNNPNLNSAGVAVQGLTITGCTVRNCVIFGNRTGIDINNSGGHVVRNNVIDDNRTGLIMRNQTDALTVIENSIQNNWTVGILFLDASGGSNSPVQTAANCTFKNNAIAGNWYGQIVDRQSGGSLPVPGTTNLKNFSGNWFGSIAPVISTANSAEPGYAAQIPVAYGGTAVPPGGQPDVLGPASANFDITPWLETGVDTNVDTGNGLFGFQGDFSNLTVTDDLAQTGTTNRVQEGIDLVSASTVHILAGTYSGFVDVNKKVTLIGAGSGANPAVDTILTNPGGNVLGFNASGTGGGDRVNVQNLRALGSTHGLYFASTVAFLAFQNVVSTGHSGSGLEVQTTGAISDLVLTNVALDGNNVGLRVATIGAVDGLSMTGGSVSGNQYGIYTAAGIGGPPNSNGFKNVTVSGTTFANNVAKGMYFEKISNALFTGIAVTNCGTAPSGGPAGIDINLKNGTYLPIEMVAMTLTGCGVGAPGPAGAGHGLIAKERNDSGYAPTVFSGIRVKNSWVNGCPVGMSFQCKALVEGNDLTGNTVTGLSCYSEPVGNPGLVDAGDWTDSNVTGLGGGGRPLGSSLGNNLLTGYGFDNAPPFAITNFNAAGPGRDLLAHDNSFGAGPGQNLDLLFFDGDDSLVAPPIPLGALAQVRAAESGPLTVSCPSNVATGCSSGIPVAAADLATFIAAGGSVSAAPVLVSSADTITGTTPCSYTVTRIYTVTDDCGRTANCTQTITVTDTTGPVAGLTVANPLTIQCGANVAPGVGNPTGTATGTDACGGPVTMNFSDVVTAGVCPIAHTITRTWVVRDVCLNATTIVQTINVLDTTPPILTLPADTTVSCDQSTAPTATGTAGASDNCDPSVVVTHSDTVVPGSCANSSTILRVWTATDDCLNSVNGTQTITVVDITAPVLTPCPSNIVVSTVAGTCAAPATWTPPTANDACAGPVVPVGSHAPGSSFGLGITTVTYTATDACGNSVSCSFTVTVQDLEAPTVTCPGAQTVPAGPGCTGTIPDVTVLTTASDFCPGVVTLTQSPSAGTSVPVGTHVVTVTATDAAGNTAFCTVSVTVSDGSPPTITCPPPITVGTDPGSCDATGVALGTPIFGDNCPGATVSNDAPSSFPLGTTTVTWTVTDASMLTAFCTQTVTVVDLENPVITCPANVTVGIMDPRDPYATGTATATDNCTGSPVVTFSDDRSGMTGCNATGVILRTWTAIDTAGNTAFCVQSITIVDALPPIVGPCPPNQLGTTDPGLCTSVETFADPVAYDQGFAESFEDPAYVVGAGNPLTPSTSWNDYNSHLTRVPSGHLGVTSSHGNAHAIIDSTTLPASPNDFTGVFSRQGGYSNVFGQGFESFFDVFVDLNDPAIVGANPISGYGWDLSAAVNNQAGGHRRDFVFHAASYGPGQVTIGGSNNSNFTRRNDLGTINHYTITSTGWYTFQWVYRDNGSGVLAVDLNLRDSSGTLLWTETRSDPSDLIATVVGGNRYMWFTFLEVDQLAVDHSRVLRRLVPACSPPSGTAFPVGSTPVVCSATDACGNSNNCSFSVTVTDVELPSITCPPTVTVPASPGLCTAPAALGSPTTGDNCGVAGVVNDAPALFPVGSTPVTWTVTDVNGNTNTCLQTVVVQDLEDPTIGCPPNLSGIPADTGLCTASGVNLGTPTTADNCGVASVTNNAPVSFPVGTTTVTWTVTDVNGRTATCMQTVTVVDAQPPSITCPPALTAPTDLGLCSASGVSLGVPSALDNCSVASVTNNAPGSFPIGSTTVTWTATDGAGNTAVCTQVVTVVDNENPLLSCPPTASVECSASPTPALTGTPTATDNCTAPGAIIFSFSDGPTAPSGPCPIVGSFVRTWSGTDAAGNTGYCSQTINLVDTTAPTQVRPPNITIECGVVGTDPSNTGMATATDNCDATPTITYTDVTNQGTCPTWTVVTRTWIATDDCGNTSTGTQIITVIDTTPPSITCPPGMTVDCVANIPAPAPLSAVAVDLCDPSVMVFHVSDDPLVGGPCGGLVVRTYGAVDDCGNVGYCTQNFTVNDTIAPTILGCPTAITVSNDTGACSAVVSWTPPAISDNCGSPTIVASHTPPFGFPVGTTTVSYTATDACGNLSTCSFTVTVNDTELPTIVCPPNLGAVPADAASCAATGVALGSPTTGDNCGVASTTNNAPGSFPVGTTTVIWTVTDVNGNSNTCAQTVTVVDTQPPTITCPPTVSTVNDAGVCVATSVALGTPSTSDNCGVASIGNNAPSSFPVGNTTVTWTVTDVNGRTNTCTQTVNVADNELPTITCPPNLGAVPADTASCAATGVALGAPTTTDNCGIASVTSDAPTSFPVGTTSVIWTVIDVNGNTNTCTQSVTVVDTQPPTITCPPTVSVFTDPGVCIATAVALGTPATADNCGVAGVANDAPPSYPVGSTTVTWTVTDVNGLTAICTQTVTVVDNQNPSITCPAPISTTTDLGLCTATVALGMPVTSDNCVVASVTNDAPTGFPVGSTTVTWTVTDVNGNTNFCTQSVTVIDGENPTITCPTAVTVSTDVGLCTASGVALGTPTTADNCGVASIANNAPAVFPLGPTVVTWIVTDVNGNTNSCAQTVTVVDTTPPTVVCPADFTVQAAPGVCDAVVTFPAPVANDLCTGIASLVCVPASGSILGPGAHVVTCTATDGAGNSAFCTFTVTVVTDWKRLDSYPTTGQALDVVVADMGDGLGSPLPDGRKDLVACTASGQVTIFFNDGTTDFDTIAPVTFVYPTGVPRALAAGDFNGDGDVDLAVALDVGNSRLSILENTGTVPIEILALNLSSVNPVAVAAGDLDGTGPLDAVLVARGTTPPGTSSGVHIVRAMNFGLNTATVSAPTISGTSVPIDVVICDLDADSEPDFAVADEGLGIRLFRVDTGPFTVTGAGTLAGVATNVALSCGDVDGDQLADDLVLAANRVAPPAGVVSVFVNTNDATPTALSTALFAAREDAFDAFGLSDVVMADLQTDTVNGNFPGAPALRCANDVVVVRDASPTGDHVGQFLRFNCGGPGVFDLFQACAFAADPTAVTAGDLNNDGLPDLVTANAGDNSVKVMCATMRALADPFGTPCPAPPSLYTPIPVISASPFPIEGLTCNVLLTNAPPATGCVLGVSAFAVESPLGPGCNLYLGFPIYLLPTPLGTVTDGLGQASFGFFIPPGLFTGASLYCQWAVFDAMAPGGYSLTTGLHLRIGL